MRGIFAAGREFTFRKILVICRKKNSLELVTRSWVAGDISIADSRMKR